MDVKKTASPKHFFVGKDGTQKEILKQATHGDMVIEQGFIRSDGVSFVKALNEDGSACEKTLVKKDESGSGYCNIPVSITMHFEDPVAVYKPLLTVKAAEINKWDWYCIEIDAVKHQALLNTVTGNKPIAAKRTIVYFVAGEQPAGYYIFNPDTPEETVNFWKKLNKSTPEKYLQKDICYLTESEHEKIRLKNKSIYETKFIKWLQTLQPGATLWAEKRFPEGVSQHAINFVSVEQQSEIYVVKAIDEDQENKELIFTPEYIHEKGDLAKVYFWVNKETGRHLNPPVDDWAFQNFK